MTFVGPDVDDPSVNRPRRYYLLRSQIAFSARVWDYGAVFRSLQDGAGAVLLPQDFPSGAVGSSVLQRLNAARYTTFEDLDGANADELVQRACLTEGEARAVLAALATIRQQRTTMGYNRGNNPPLAEAYANTLDLGFGSGVPIQSAVTLAGATLTVNGPTLELGDRGTARAVVNVTAISSTGADASLAAKLQTSADGTTWNDVASWTAITTVSVNRKLFAPIDRFMRFVGTLTGTTPSVTFSVTGEAC